MSTLVENVAKVTAAHAALKTAIESKSVTVPDGTKLSAMPALVEQIQTGGTSEPNMERAVFTYGTSSAIALPKTVIVDMSEIVNLRFCFSSCVRLESLTLFDGFGAKATNMQSCFSECEKLTSLTLPNGCGTLAETLMFCFYNCSKLVSVSLPDGFGAAATNLDYCFSFDKSLTTITGTPNFKASLDLHYCIALSHDSLMVIINGLQTVEGKTLTLGAENLAKLTDEEKKIATDKGWTIA